MDEAGYHLVSDEDMSAGGGDGALIELTAASGEQDQTLLLGRFVSGRRVVLVESASEVGCFAPRREAVVAAIKRLRP